MSKPSKFIPSPETFFAVQFVLLSSGCGILLIWDHPSRWWPLGCSLYCANVLVFFPKIAGFAKWVLAMSQLTLIAWALGTELPNRFPKCDPLFANIIFAGVLSIREKIEHDILEAAGGSLIATFMFLLLGYGGAANYSVAAGVMVLAMGSRKKEQSS